MTAGGGCYGSVLLHDELWTSLSAMNGRKVPWVHGCVLAHGHDGDHGAPAHALDGATQQWLRWPDGGPARIEAAVESAPPGRHSRPVGSTPDRPTPRPVSRTAATPADRPGDGVLPTPATQAEALWAIAAALERLTDAVAAYLARDD